MESTIKLYPNIEDVLTDTSLVCYFRPLLTCNYIKDNVSYKIHLFGTDGVFSVEYKALKYSEGRFFGFQYNNGIYKFLGNIENFEYFDQIPLLYLFLKTDFDRNKNEYLDNNISFRKYYEKIGDGAQQSCNIDESEFEYIEFYAEAFYSYEFTKYHYEKSGNHKHITVLTEDYGENNSPFLLPDDEAQSMLTEFFMNLKWNLKNSYNINQNMYCCAIDSFRFMSTLGSYSVFALLDDKEGIVYNLAYGS